jgi:hypothetical protein
MGPYSWPGTRDAPSVFDMEVGRRAGIYLWTVPLEQGHLIYYVGETGRSFSARLHEHYTEHVASMYHVYSPAEFARGEKVALWPGRFDATQRKSVKECIQNHARLCDQIREMTFILRFFLAPLCCDKRTQQRIEAAIAQALYAAPGIVGSFQDRGIRYCSRTKDEQPIPCVTSSPLPLLGLPGRFWA